MAAAVGFVALIGMLILVAFVVAAYQPSHWVATAMAVALPVGAAGLAWLVASALARNRPRA